MKIDLSKITDKKVIGTGMFGTAYLIKLNNIKYVVKVQKILPSDRKKSFKSEIWRELDFYDYINKLSDDKAIFFTKLLGWEIYDNCKHIQKRPHKLPKKGKWAIKMKKLDNSQWCIEYVLEYKGDMLMNFIDKKNITRKQIYSFILQFYAMCSILQKGGYLHNDLHFGNVTVQKTDKKYIKYDKIKIPTYGYILSAIDYGGIIHNKYKHDYKFFKKNPKLANFGEFRWAYISLFNNGIKTYNDQKRLKKKMPWERKNFMNNYLIKVYENYSLFWEKIKKICIKNHFQTKKYFELFEQTKDLKKLDKLKKKEGRRLSNIFIDYIYYYFALYYPKKHSEYYGWATSHRFKLPKNESHELLQMTKMKEVAKYAIKQLKN